MMSVYFNYLMIGALTSKPYAFKVRPWELKKIEMINFLDGFGDLIRLDYRGGELVRILPKEFLKFEWISDKVRFMYDGLIRQRIMKPYIKKWDLSKKENVVMLQNWNEILLYQLINYNRLTCKIDGVVGSFSDLETQFLFKDFLNKTGNETFAISIDGIKINSDFRRNYLFKFDLTKLENYKMLLLVGLNLRLDYPLLNYKVRKIINKGFVGIVGFINNLGYAFTLFSNQMLEWLKIVEGRHLIISMMMFSSLSLIFLGNSLKISGIEYIDRKLFNINYKLNINIINSTISSAGGFDFGGISENYLIYKRNILEKWLYLLDIDEVSSFKKGFFDYFDYEMVIYQGHHGDINAEKADIIFPGVLPIEKQSLYMSIEGKILKNFGIILANSQSLIDWKILNVMSFKINTLKQLLKKLEVIFIKDVKWLLSIWIEKKLYKFGNVSMVSWNKNMITDSITRSSILLNIAVNRSFKGVWWLNL